MFRGLERVLARFLPCHIARFQPRRETPVTRHHDPAVRTSEPIHRPPLALRHLLPLMLITSTVAMAGAPVSAQASGSTVGVVADERTDHSISAARFLARVEFEDRTRFPIAQDVGLLVGVELHWRAELCAVRGHRLPARVVLGRSHTLAYCPRTLPCCRCTARCRTHAGCGHRSPPRCRCTARCRILPGCAEQKPVRWFRKLRRPPASVGAARGADPSLLGRAARRS